MDWMKAADYLEQLASQQTDEPLDAGQRASVAQLAARIRSGQRAALLADCRFAFKSETWRFERRVLSLTVRFGCLWSCASGALLRNMINCGKQTWLSLEGAQQSNSYIVVGTGAGYGRFYQRTRLGRSDRRKAEQPHFRSGALKSE